MVEKFGVKCNGEKIEVKFEFEVKFKVLRGMGDVENFPRNEK
jgi:hypothetical protein